MPFVKTINKSTKNKSTKNIQNKKKKPLQKPSIKAVSNAAIVEQIKTLLKKIK
jgi:hypothetical protein